MSLKRFALIYIVPFPFSFSLFAKVVSFFKKKLFQKKKQHLFFKLGKQMGKMVRAGYLHKYTHFILPSTLSFSLPSLHLPSFLELPLLICMWLQREGVDIQ